MAVTTDEPRGGGVADRAGTFMRLTGAVVSLGLMVGVSVWGYRLFVRDMTGVPVVRAMAGPMREAPAEPGGQIALHTGLAVNAVAALGGAAPPEDVLVLAPATAGLAPEDMEVQSVAEAGEVVAGDPGAFAVPPVQPGIVTVAAEAVPEGAGSGSMPAPEPAPLPAAVPETRMTAAEVLALADMIAAGAEPLTPLAPSPAAAGSPAPGTAAARVAEALAATAAAPEAGAGTEPAESVAAALLPSERISPDVPGVRVAWRPPARPGSVAVAGAQDPVPEAEPVSLIGPPVPAGTALVQLGAYETAEIAAADWVTLAERFADFMGGKERVIQAAESGGEAFVRLRASGFGDIAEANRFCAALIAEGARCVPVIEE
jgi:hypothetical protein